MACLKCGNKTKDEQTFCPRCLAAMDAYPVKTDIRVQLPNRKEVPVFKKAPRKRSPEEQVQFLRTRLRRLTVLVVVLVLLLLAAGVLFYLALTKQLLFDELFPKIFG